MLYNKDLMNSKAFAFIYGYAIRDAILQQAFKGGKKEWIEKIPEAHAVVRGYVSRVLNGDFSENSTETKAAHDACFIKTARDVCDAINQKRPEGVTESFSFGNAQKLINIITKHIYAHSYTLNLLDCVDIRSRFRFCHCPMDSIMLKTVWDKYGELFGNSERRNKLGYSTEFRKSWGSEDFEISDGERIQPQRYTSYQTAINRIINEEDMQIFPMEYDYLVWKVEENNE